MYRTNLIKLLSLIFIISLFTLTGCGKQTSKSNKTLVKDTHPTETTKNALSVNDTCKKKKDTKIYKQKDNTQNEVNTPNTKSESSKTHIENSNKKSIKQNLKKENNKTKEIFYGTWVIHSIITWGPVSCYDDKQAKDILGSKLVYSKDIFKFNKNKLNTPYYKKEVLNNNDFYIMYKIPLSKLGIKTSKTTVINIYEDKEYLNTWNSTGSTLIRLDKNTLIILDNGVYFKAIRKN